MLAAVITPAVTAATRAGARYGFVSDSPAVLHESNNTVVWLHPHEIVAKVGTWAESAGLLRHEHAVGVFLASRDAPIAPPARGTEPAVDDETGYIVTLWERVRVDQEREPSTIEIADSLRNLHTHLAAFGGELPSFQVSLDRVQSALATASIPALRPDDRHVLLTTFERTRQELQSRRYIAQPLHGEPHGANFLVSSDGIRWIDLEEACTGPLEWDVAFLPPPAAAQFHNIDPELLSLLQTLSSACVATWCWIRWDLPEMRWHARRHLEVVRQFQRNKA